jgi:hypothetical protein
VAHQLEALRRVSDKGICSLAVALWLLAGCSSMSAPGTNLGGAGEASFWLPYTTEDQSVVATYGPEIAVDTQGGVHIAYTITAGQDAGRRPAYYLYCPSSCSDPQSWHRTRLGDDVAEVRLQLNPSGQPRIMLYVDPSTGPDDMVYSYQYAACDGGCEDRAQWTITLLTTSHALESYRSEYTNHYFALIRKAIPVSSTSTSTALMVMTAPSTRSARRTGLPVLMPRTGMRTSWAMGCSGTLTFHTRPRRSPGC